ncbi:rhomboid family intramembrane serine protease [Bartonella choladocola]|uniref:Membrane associated serine protease, rhomboid family n=1 Tax=Bartonella choladocola TaxID=2750995 RepID=A0A1U9MGQ5_9HYPH|nr:rhomboid family intramembrane serine protease [Bartonella choladocola]AQT47084.1 Membrane associated serine protease, rhomboid family [Bartonella choladocola]
MNNDYNDHAFNRRQHTPLFNIPTIIVIIVAVCAFSFLIPEYFFSPRNYDIFYTYLAFIPDFFSHAFLKFWYTPVSYSFLHASLMHVGVNMMWLVIFGSPLANRIGSLRFIVFWCVCSAAAAFAHLYIYPDSYVPMVGASGAISGMMGAAARYGFRQVQNQGYRQRSEFAGPILSIGQSLVSKNVVVFIGTWIIIDIITGIATPSIGGEESSIAWVAHIGGLLAGFFLIGIFDKRRNQEL